MLPVLVTVMVALTGWPAGSTVPGEFGSPLLVTAGGVNEIVPVNGVLRADPSFGPTVTNDTAHRPGTGAPWKNCKVPPAPTASLTADCRSMPWSKGGTRVPSTI